MAHEKEMLGLKGASGCCRTLKKNSKRVFQHTQIQKQKHTNTNTDTHVKDYQDDIAFRC